MRPPLLAGLLLSVAVGVAGIGGGPAGSAPNRIGAEARGKAVLSDVSSSSQPLTSHDRRLRVLAVLTGVLLTVSTVQTVRVSRATRRARHIRDERTWRDSVAPSQLIGHPRPSPAESALEDADAPASSSKTRRIRELAFYPVVAIVVLIVNSFAIQAFVIPSSSMEPTIKPRDRVLVNELSYRFHEVHRGDIVVLKNPEADDGSGMKRLLKRVVGLPGEKVEGRNQRVVINGRVLSEPYLGPGVVTTDLDTILVPSGHYLVLGDNRGDSEDGRFFGTIPGSSIVGRAFVRVWPPGSIDML